MNNYYLGFDDFNEEELNNRLSYKFKDKQLLQKALTRKSSYLEKILRQVEAEHNERLEFFGDSILRTVIDDMLITLYPEYNEAQLSQARDKLVANHGFLYEFAASIDLISFAKMGKGEHNNCNDKGKYKILTSIMEAIIAAVFIDSNRDYKTVEAFIYNMPSLNKYITTQTVKDKKLYVSVKNGDLVSVNHWLAHRANPKQIINDSYIISCPCHCSLAAGVTGWSEVMTYSPNKSTPLDLAIRWQEGHNSHTLDIVSALLKHGANPNYIGTFKYPLLHETIIYYPKLKTKYNFYSQFCKLLCQHGANLNLSAGALCCNTSTQTPLELAIMFADYEKVAVLLKYGANPNLKNAKGQTPLLMAAICYDLQIENRPLKQSLFFDANYLKKTKEAYLNIFHNLLKYNADSEIADQQGKKAIDYPHIRNFMQQYQPKLTIKNQNYQNT